jgi:RNA polymerase sigma-70 factor (ECF subfamily)
MLAVVRRVLGGNHAEVDDVCQEAAVGFLSALTSFRAECTVMHFACRVALLTALSSRRRTRRERAMQHESCDEVDEFVDHCPSPAEQVDAARRRQILRELLDELPLAQAEVLALHIVLGYTVEETSAMTVAPVNTVRSRLRRGLAALRDVLVARGTLSDVVGGRHEQTE